mmetsp:Transcript_22156/g.41557  ORF Transcript_22156/g.41557 Transcript_22156/m.41557 type:complete len:115 (-) Transcript_22156:224-568(-)
MFVSTVGRIPQVEFISAWRQRLPSGIEPNAKHLEGIILIDDNHAELFPARNLPSTPKDCFAVLFGKKQRWSLQDLAPYIEHLLGPGTLKADLLRKFTRSVRVSLDSEDRVLVAR